ncbi:PLP-dependent aminotransferase family protein [Methylobacillus flagellatus]|uniref:Transcriptional regulator, GntR family n=1 Tax=Methylobacillus flagellatus (strain ATCC 51484 / DSM 6875 / VKM B-1610 / KT) TaxID=265072 RepID=Q1H028_METFK|nr:PLP-dependent aminotransferase family protein [Methylobacillus flagellatus]ABE50159.1 transcriptional regulator, GntR family [Methylobacillus flagellatus KT]
MKRYEKLVHDIATAIRSGVLAPGEKLPSVRQACLNHKLSPATVFRAYYELENLGLIRAQPKSGYYVSNHAIKQLASKTTPVPEQASTVVSISDMVFSILSSIKDPETVPLGSAFPWPDLFPLARLSRSLAHATRDMGPAAIVESLPPGNHDLRRQIARRYLMQGVEADVDNILITNGAFEALNLCLEAVTQPGDLVAIESPTFHGCLQALERLQLKAVEIPVDPVLGMDLDYLESVLEKCPVRACWSMTSFQNPMGVSMPAERKQVLVELLTRYRIPLIEDDVYGELYFGMQEHRPAKAYDSEGYVMHCSSFSKTLAPGYRIGWALLPKRFERKVERLKVITSLSTSTIAQAAIADFLQHGGYDRHLRRLRTKFELQQHQYLHLIARYFPAETQVTRPHGGYFLWVDLPERVDALVLFQRALEQGVSVAPGPIFSARHQCCNCIRINYSKPVDAEVEQAFKTLGRLMSSIEAAAPGH